MDEIKLITVDEAESIRKLCLKNDYPLDWHEDAYHLGAYTDGQLVAICSLYPENPQEQVTHETYRIRSLATLPEHRGKGLGKTLVEHCVAYAKQQRARFIWCNARTKAANFYKHCGFTQEGSPTSLPGIGGHFFLKKVL
ncbi:MAG: hypothetical protein SP1CHLAM54_11170 [Chlamydiia bacterium]|nr:hypothetical protein [Chlamydiia bacterium]MCH9616020.1 hypothetical protein [Chlamydiia bacterium]MCH9629043.1 hypothetical protein [Chlamydiia bacterium]